MNSFRFIERGIRAEIARQEAILAAGGRSSRRRCTSTPPPGAITSLRSKEEAHDYRYFPEPDLRAGRDRRGDARRRARGACPSCPPARAERFERELGAERRKAPACSPSAPSSATTSSARSPPAPSPRRRATDARQLDRAATCSRARTTGRTPPSRVSRRPRSRRSCGLVAAKLVSVGAAAQVLDVLVAEGGDPRRSSRPRARPRSTAATSSPRWSLRRSPPTPTRPSRCAPATPRRSGRSLATSCARPRAAPTAARSPQLVHEQLGV